MDATVATIRQSAVPLTGGAEDFDPLLELIGDARFVLLGEASHGTDEFYRARAAISRRLILEKGFSAVAVEADWPDAYLINRYVRCEADVPDDEAALAGFRRRFPTWMWRNTAVRDFIRWMRSHNDAIDDPRGRAGFYGIDLYSLFASIEAVVDYLDRVDPEAARRARGRYECFEHFGEDPQRYGRSAAFGLDECEDEVVAQLVELQRAQSSYEHRDGLVAADEYFFAEQNARLVLNAERYYRSMYQGRTSSWNLRDRHMSESLEALAEHLSETGRRARVVVWAHNSHLGDARATSMGAGGELNVGQLTRQLHGDDAVLVGFTTYEGTVTAAHEWDEPPRLRAVRPGLPGSYERLFHDVGIPDFLLRIRDDEALQDALDEPRLERAIGVIYRPETERMSHYFDARLSEQFDAVIHYDRTHAVRPLERWPVLEAEEPPETYPTGL